MRSQKVFIWIMLLLGIGFTQVYSGALVDEFDRSSLGGNWVTEPAYGIQSGTLANTTTNTGWNYLATFTGAVNPDTISFQFSSGLSDEDGVHAAGIACMLDAPHDSANGYLVYRRYGSLYLYTVVKGELQTQVHKNSSVTQPYPAPGSTITVVPRKEAGGNYFDFFINGTFDATVRDLGKLQGSGSELYSGVVLYGNLLNNVEWFSVVAPFVQVTHPIGGETLPGGTIVPITWVSENFAGNVDILISYDSGANYSSIVTNVANTGTYNWTVPDVEQNNCRIMVKANGATLPVGVSLTDFAIEQLTPTITILEPNGGEKYFIGEQYTIRWEKSGTIDVVDIWYLPLGGPKTLVAANVPANQGYYIWDVPPTVFADSVKILIEKYVLDQRYWDESDDYFAIGSHVHLYVMNASGEPGTTDNKLLIGMDNDINVWALIFIVTDSRSVLTVPNVGNPPKPKVKGIGRAAQVQVSAKTNSNWVSIGILNMTGVIAKGTGPIAEIYYDIASDPGLINEHSDMLLSGVLIADINGDPVLARLSSGKFHYVNAGDLMAAFGVVDSDDLDKMIELVLKLDNPGPFMLSGDMTNDGKIDLLDLLRVYDLIDWP